MAGLGSRWAALSGRRFLLRRMDYAILGRSMPAVGDLLRAESLALPVGCSLALACWSAPPRWWCCGPPPGRAGATGDGTWLRRAVRAGRRRPAPGGEHGLGPADPERTRTAACRRRRPAGTGIERAGAGIPGAPQRIGEPIASGDAPWTVCDGADGTTTVAVGSLGDAPALARHTGVLGRGARRGGVPAVRRRACRRRSRRSGHRAHSAPRRGPSAAGLFDTADSCPRGAAHHRAAHRRDRGVSLVGGRTVGSVLWMARAGTEEYYVVLRDGLQRIGGLTADLIRFGDSRGATEITTVAADLVAASPLVDTCPRRVTPIGRPRSVHLTVTCVQPGRPDGHDRRRIRRRGCGAGAVGARGRAGPAVDQVRMPPGTMRRCHGHRSRRSHRIGGALPHHRCRSSLRAA